MNFTNNQPMIRVNQDLPCGFTRMIERKQYLQLEELIIIIPGKEHFALSEQVIVYGLDYFARK